MIPFMQMKPELQNPKVKDEVLLEKMTAAYSLEMTMAFT